MKLYAQHGHGPSDKIQRGLKEGLIGGVILGARYVQADNLKEEIQKLKNCSGTADVIVDPEYCAAAIWGAPNAQLGNLEDWGYFHPLRMADYLVKPSLVAGIVETALEVQKESGATKLIAPSIYISQSLDSMEAALSLSFLEKAVAAQEAVEEDILPTLALHRDALLNRMKVVEFVNALTGMSDRPRGIYLIVGADTSSGTNGLPPPELFDYEVLSAWMYLNFALSINRVKIVNGFSDMLSPFLCISGAHAGATGWWSNLQWYSIDRYIRSPGIRKPPLKRYLSTRLLARITARNRDAFVAIRPDIANGLPHDSDYIAEEPDRTAEMLQGWEALGALMNSIDCDDIFARLEAARNAIKNAEMSWAGLRDGGVTQGQEAASEYLRSLRNALSEFEKMAEL